MSPYFPHSTGAFKLEEPAALRRFSMSVVEMAVVTGILVRIARALALSLGPDENIVFLAASIGAGLLLLFSAATLHLGNYTVRHWLWRAPVFAVVEAAAEALTALLLILLGREPFGSSRAVAGDWPGMAVGILFWRLAAVTAYALLLAAVVQFARHVLLRREHRGHTLDAIHHETTADRSAPTD